MKRLIILWIIGGMILAAVLGCVALQLEHTDTQPSHLLRVALWDYENTQYDRELVDAFQRENPDIEVEVISYRSEVYTQNIQTLLESGERVDIIYANQMAMVTQLAEKGFCLPLDSLVDRDDIDLSQYQYVDELHSSDGSLPGLPYRIDRFVLYYNKDLFDAASLPYPDDTMTWKQFYQTATALQQYLNRTEKQQYSLFSIYIPTHWTDILTSRPFSVSDMDRQELGKGISMLMRMQQEGSMVPMQTIRARSGVQRMFESGDYGMYICGTWLMHYLQIDSKAGTCTMNWGATERPHWEGKENENSAWITSLCINRESAETEAAWRFVQFICGKKGAEIMAQNLMIPAYRDADVDHLLNQQLENYDTPITLEAESFDPPQAVASIKESEARNRVLSLVGQAVLGLIPQEDCMEQIAQIQAEFFSSDFVESYKN